MYSRVKQLWARERDGRTNRDNETTGRLSPSAGSSVGRKNTAPSEFAGRTTRNGKRPQPPRVESEQGKVRSVPRPPGGIGGPVMILRPW